MHCCATETPGLGGLQTTAKMCAVATPTTFIKLGVKELCGAAVERAAHSGLPSCCHPQLVRYQRYITAPRVSSTCTRYPLTPARDTHTSHFLNLDK